MAKRSSFKDQPAFRGVIKLEDPRTGEITYKYLGPYQTKGAVKGQITAELSRQKYYDKYYPERSKDARRIVAVGVQESIGWKNSEDWTEIND